MKDILEVMIKNLVVNQNEVVITEENTEKQVNYKVKVAQGDMGKVIGKQGRIAKSIRTIMKAVSSKEQKKVNVEFID